LALVTQFIHFKQFTV